MKTQKSNFHIKSSLIMQIIKFFGRKLLKMWGQVGIAPGWYYQTFDQYGYYLAHDLPMLSYLPNGCKIYCNLQDHVQRQVYFLGSYEPIESYIFTHLIKPRMTVIDVGANVGQYTLLASTNVGSEGAVHSFEPVPNTFQLLCKNVASNNLLNVHINQAALWDKATILNLSLADEMKDNIGAYSAGITNPEKAVESKAISLDDYVLSKQITKIDFVKMDIEGAEYYALLGMQKILNQDHPILLLEINRIALKRLGYLPEDIWNLLINEFGYKGYLIQHDGCYEISDVLDIQQSNILFCFGKAPEIIHGWNLKLILRWSRQHIYSALLHE